MACATLFPLEPAQVGGAAQRRLLRDEIAAMKSDLAERLIRQKLEIEYLWLAGIGKTVEYSAIRSEIDKEARFGNAQIRLRINAAKSILTG